MKTVEINLFKFSELSNEAKQNAISSLYDINVNYEWWEYIYGDAKEIGLEITSFDIDRNRHAKGLFINSGFDCANLILKNHGETCETFKTAKNFLAEYLPLKEKFESENDGFYFEDENDGDDLNQDFLESLLEDYSIMLQNESDYMQSDEAIIETIEANDYDFTENGYLY